MVHLKTKYEYTNKKGSNSYEFGAFFLNKPIRELTLNWLNYNSIPYPEK